MIKHDDLKYQYYGPEMPEVLFDLGRDPAEETDYSHDRHYADAMGRFRARARELGFMEKMA
jgi:choline-sulfatase